MYENDSKGQLGSMSNEQNDLTVLVLRNETDSDQDAVYSWCSTVIWTKSTVKSRLILTNKKSFVKMSLLLINCNYL